MEYTTLGRTGLRVSRSAFGALPIQRVSREDSIAILRAAFDGGINFFDTARYYHDSESKIGAAFDGMREEIVIATKSPASDGEQMTKELHASLENLRTDYIDVYQFHLAKKCHRPGESDGLYDAAAEAKRRGLIRHIGLTSHRPDAAMEAARSGLYDTIQFPFSYLSGEIDIELVRTCERSNIGFIAMKALSGGLITNARLAFAFMRQFGGVVPIWGIQKREELDEFLALEKEPPAFDEKMRAMVEREKSELSGNFCRACGYCLPCPANIELNWIARMPQALRRMKPETFLTNEWRQKMELVNNCVHCGSCAKKCPYELNPEALIKTSYDDYVRFAAEWDARRCNA
jgi:aryl-alcohol dehydrogenase-like predicted oxidoreductase